MKVKEINAKSVITKSQLPEADLVLNPYIGCQHACIYCYADFMKRFTNHSKEEWGSFVDVKVNALETINPKKIPKRSVVLLGSVTDPYQPLESRYQITKKCLERLLNCHVRVEILTKSSLILRDIDLLKKFKNLKVGMSVGILDSGLSRKLEPCASSPQQRLETLKRLHKEGINTYLFISPIFPKISKISELLELTKDYVGEVMFENINIRPNNKRRILKFIQENKPSLIDFYERLSKNQEYWDSLEKEIIQECKDKRIKYKIFFHHRKNG